MSEEYSPKPADVINPPIDKSAALDKAGNTLLTRRQMLRTMLFGGGLAAVGSLAACSISEQSSQSTRPEIPPTTTPEAAAAEYMMSLKGVSVHFDTLTRLPLRWETEAGSSGLFDPHEMQMLAKKAQETGEAQVAQVVRVPIVEEVPIQESREKLPLPDDILTPEQLAQRGIEIIQAEGMALYLRPGMFEPGELLEQFQEGSGTKLVICLTDAPVVRAEAFDHARYDRVRDVTEHMFQHDRTIESVRPEGQLELMRSAYNNLMNEDGWVDIEEKKIAKAVELLTEEDVAKLWLFPNTTRAFYAMPKPEGERPQADTAFLFLSTGRRQENIPFVAITVDPQQGSFQLEPVTVNVEELFHLGEPIPLDSSQAYPRVEDYDIRTEGGAIFEKMNAHVDFHDRTQGFVVRHEMAHSWRTRALANTLEPKVVWDERETDKTALESIKRAQEKYDQGDDRGYGVVLEDKMSGVVVVT